ncbi:hypothetical protein P4O66_018687 [Electrophorus voltai]|uniref:Uncharacterized protein n=1 Tax=Electrophorus voltai TaxID=2609070 RepID=A0AAD8YQ47_9TELE|nr:hypothetical protein P4O66_018687 [Electrophorus voltai]
MHWRCWPGWLRCLAPLAAAWSVVQLEAPLHPSVGLMEAMWRLCLAGVLWTGLGLVAALARLLLRHAARPQREMVSQNVEESMRKTGQSQQECLISEHKAGRLVAVASALLDGLVVSVLQEPLSEPSLSQLRGLLVRLEAVSQAVSEGGLPDWPPLKVSEKEQEEEARMSEEQSLLVARARHICTYLQDRVRALSSFLQVQAKYCACVADIQQGLQEHWEQLETLHSKVTLQPQAAGDPSDPGDPRTVLTCTQFGLSHSCVVDQSNGYRAGETPASDFHLVNGYVPAGIPALCCLLYELKEEQERLAGSVGLTLGPVWIKDFLQCNTEQFEKVYKDFTCLEQQMQTFVLHLRGLQASAQERDMSTDARHLNVAPPTALCSAPTYRAAGPGPFTDPEPLPRTRSAVSAMDCLCGFRRRRPKTLVLVARGPGTQEECSCVNVQTLKRKEQMETISTMAARLCAGELPDSLPLLVWSGALSDSQTTCINPVRLGPGAELCQTGLSVPWTGSPYPASQSKRADSCRPLRSSAPHRGPLPGGPPFCAPPPPADQPSNRSPALECTSRQNPSTVVIIQPFT